MLQYRINVVSVAALIIRVLEDNKIFFVIIRHISMFLFFICTELLNTNNSNIWIQGQKVDIGIKKNKQTKIDRRRITPTSTRGKKNNNEIKIIVTEYKKKWENK